MNVVKLIESMIADYEQMRDTITNRLQELYDVAKQLGIEHTPQSKTSVIGNDIRAEIEKKRNEIMAQAEQIKLQALSQAKSFNGMPSIPNMPMFPNAFARRDEEKK